MLDKIISRLVSWGLDLPSTLAIIISLIVIIAWLKH